MSPAKTHWHGTGLPRQHDHYNHAFGRDTQYDNGDMLIEQKMGACPDHKSRIEMGWSAFSRQHNTYYKSNLPHDTNYYD